jgi:hypothetical protein
MFRGSALAAVAVAVVVATGMAAFAQDTLPQIAQAPAATVVVGTSQFENDPDLRCDLLQVKRISGGALLIRWRIINTAGQTNAASGGFANSTTAKTIRYPDFSWEQLYYIDPAENKKYLPLTDSANNRILEMSWNIDLAPGQQRLNWAKFPAPPPGSAKISVSIPNFSPFEDVPIAQ